MDRASAISKAIQIFKAADTDQNGAISFSEWCAAGINLHQQTPTNKIEAVLGKAVDKRIKD